MRTASPIRVAQNLQQRCRLSATALAVASLLGPWAAGSADAASCSWLPSSGNWDSASNWSCGIVPSGGNSDSASIVAGQLVTINSLTPASQFQSVLNLNNAGTVTLDAFGLSLQGGGGTLNGGVINVGGASTAALQIGGGHNFDNTGGTVNVGVGSVINQFGSSFIGGVINTTGSGSLVAYASGSNVLSGVTLAGTLDMATNNGIERITGGLTLNGTVNIGANSIFAPQGDQTLGGTGSIVFADNNGSNRFNVEAGNLVLGSGITVRGNTGVIGQQLFVGGASSLTNNGTIQADVAGGTITLAVSGPVINNGTLAAKNGGTLLLNNSVTSSTGSQILAGAGSTVIQNGVALSGAINVTGGGTFRPSSSGNNVMNAASFSGVLDLASANGIERVVGGLTLNGTVNIGANSIFAPQGDQTIAGSGAIVFADNNGSNRFNLEAGNLVLGSGITVRGNTGVIGQQAYVGGAASLTNNGTIQADVAGGTITLAVNGPVTNNGTLAALNGGTLLLNSSITNSSGSQIVAASGGTVVQNGVSLNGVINVASGAIQVSSSGNNYFNGVSFSGVLDLASANGIERVTGGLTLNNATINIGANSILAPQGDQTIAGAGTIIFADNNGSNRFNLEAGNLVLGSGITVRGNTGVIGQQAFAGGAASLTNNGTIQADVGGGTITLQVSGPVTNNGTLAAKNGGTLLLNNSINNNPGSQILADVGSTVIQNGVTLNGAINVTGGGSFRPSSSGSNFLDGASFSGVLDMASGNAIERVAGGLTLNGTINIGANSILAPQGNQTITGNGSIVFADSNGSNRFNVEAGNLVLDTGITVRGGNGFIGQQLYVGGAATLTNKGLINADTTGTAITVEVNGGITNVGTMAASNGGTLAFNGNGPGIAGGVLLAGTGSVVAFSGTAVTGSTLNGAGRFVPNGSSGNFLNGTTINGVVDMASSQGLERISAGGMTLNGSIQIGANSIFAPQGDQTITGTGSIVFADNNGSNRFNVEAGNLVIDTGITVHGVSGTIGQQLFAGGAATLTNLGTINSDGGGAITIAVSGGFTNNGLLRAQAGTLNVQNALAGSGTLQVDAAGTVNLANAANTQGKLAMGAAGAVLNIGPQNLVITSDYTNVAAGSGDSFAKRAGISGAGLVLAGGDVAQAVTGAGISGGGTATPTLTLGNVRVGATTVNYQIANAGSTGPTLRGALQTGVNGGNISDARLSGSGVSQGLYSTGGPGSSSGNFGVTLTVASAGPVAQLVGQKVNLTSNFSNIADQTLSIVMGSGAAAYNAAVGSTAAPVVVAAQRVGGSNTALLNVSNTAAAGLYSEDLNAGFSGFAGAVSGSGSVSGLLAGASNASAMSVAVNTATSGVKTGSATLAYQTTGSVAGVSNGLGVASVGTQVVNVSGNVYAPAVAQLSTPAVNFGIVRVGDVVAARTVTVGNSTSGALTDTLNATLSGGAAPFAASGSISGLAAGSSNASSLTVALNTATAGVYTGSASLAYSSHNPEMADLALNSGTVTLAAQVNNLAAAALAKTSGAGSFSGGGNSYTLNFGTLQLGAASVSAALTLGNAASGPADALAGSFDLSALLAGSPFTLTGFNSFAGLAAGSGNSLGVAFSGLSVGSYDSVVVLNGVSTNGSGPDLGLTPIAIHLQGSVVAVPEPATWALWLGGALMLGTLARRRSRVRA